MPWQPWAELRRRPHIDLLLAPLPVATGGGVISRRGARVAIILDAGLDRRARRCALAHELVHDEIGDPCRAGHMPATWDDVIARQEHAIDREVARRLVPAHELSQLAAARCSTGEPLEAAAVADHFDVTDAVAELAMSLAAAAPAGWGEVVA